MSGGNLKKAKTKNVTEVNGTENEFTYLEDVEDLQSRSREEDASEDENDEIQLRNFRKTDEYHLPKLKEFRIKKDDERIMPKEEFQELSELGYDYVDGININSVDPSSKEFEELPMPTQYMILSHLRLRSRLRMGYDKDQLSSLFPNSMDFSMFQIKQVQKRNFYTQKLMNVAGMNDDGSVTRRVAGSKDREYTLARSDNGWTLALDNGGRSKDRPIKLDEFGYVVELDDEEEVLEVKDEEEKKMNLDSDSDDDFEDVPIKPMGSQAEIEQKGEGDVDDDIQKAIVQSIYDQYEGKGVSAGDESEGFDEVELRRAIDNSKRDLVKLREEEGIAKRNVFKIGQVNNEKTKKPDNIIDDIDLNFDSSVFGKSILFGNSKNNEAEVINVKIGTEPVRKKQQTDNPEDAKDGIYEPTFSDDNEKVKEVIEPRVVQEIPSWFNNTISEINNPHVQKSTAPKERPKEYVQSKLGTFEEKKRKYQEDEEAGLISWSEANAMINPAEDEDDNIDEDAGQDIVITDYKKVSDGDVEIVKEYQMEQEDVQNEIAIEQDSEIEKNIGAVLELEKDVEEIDAEKEVERPVVPLEYDFEEEDEDKLIQQIEEEEVEHEQFKSKIIHDNPLNNIQSSITDEQLLQEQYQKSKRDSDEVTQSMVSDVQELLKRFGIPYITAPMEAEAQCAELIKLGLVDGIVTDDSDCFLFGGDRIYKNMFNQKNYVECYISSEIETRLGLSQDKLIELALLLGSDYTDGIRGIGPVLAMEILAEFGTLENFKKWFDKNTLTTAAKNLDNSTPLKKSLLTKIKSGKFFLPENFPDSIVFEAYKKPEVDDDDAKFQWGFLIWIELGPS